MSNSQINTVVANTILNSMNGIFPPKMIHDVARSVAKSNFILPKEEAAVNSQLIVTIGERKVMFTPHPVNVGALAVSVVSSLVASLGVANNVTMLTAGGLVAALASVISAYTVTLNSQETAYLYELSIAGSGWQNAQLITNQTNANLPPLEQISGNGYNLAQSLKLKGAKLDWTDSPPPSVLLKDFILGQ